MTEPENLESPQPAPEVQKLPAGSTTAPPEEPQPIIPIVGIGASAGGLEAFEQLLAPIPPDAGIALIIIQHLAPHHESLLTDLLAASTQMPVIKVEETTRVEPGRVYVIPPKNRMTLQDGELHLEASDDSRLAIDHFFYSLAAEQDERSIGILLSGTGTDGTLGLQAIHDVGGYTIVQAPDKARFAGMPQHAIDNVVVDMILPPEEIAAQLIDYVNQRFSREELARRSALPDIRQHLHQITALLQTHTGHDFSGYKESTVGRRIDMRMAAAQVTRVEEYITLLQENPVELEALFRGLLIGVTSFFRDPQAFETLEAEVITPLFAQKAADQQMEIRVWVPGCATGEEAYSLAILLHEHATRANRPVDIQIFATDINQEAIHQARAGRYPAAIAAAVSAERLEAYFTLGADNSSYEVSKPVRDMVVFAAQSVIKDPPFSNLDLICCRNLLIYLRPALQQRLLSLFHYALKRGGYLFLGNSESLGPAQRLFSTLNQKWKIFKREDFLTDIKTVLDFSGRARPTLHSIERFSRRPMDVRELTEQFILATYAPTSILINEKGEMLYVHGSTGKFLEQRTGEISTNILHVAREGLRMPLASAIRAVSSQKAVHQVSNIAVRQEAGTARVELTVAPIHRPAPMQGLMLVTLTELSTHPGQAPPPSPSGAEPDYSQEMRILELEQELKTTREFLQTVIEELETTNEELLSFNEELQSANEELQSTNEEIQTSREELQSVNDDLSAVNIELHQRVDDLNVANNDIKILLESTRVSMIFLDKDLRIQRFTESSRNIVELIPEDVGRPFKQFVHKLRYGRLLEDAQKVLDTLESKAVEVQSEDGAWYFLRLMPHRPSTEHIAGVVLTLTDVTALKQSELRLAATVSTSGVGMYQHAVPIGPELFVGARWANILGYEQRELPDHHRFEAWLRQQYHPADAPAVQAAYAGFVAGTQERFAVEARMRHKDETWIHVLTLGHAVSRDAAGRATELLCTMLDISAIKEAEKQIARSEAQLRATLDSIGEAVIATDVSGRITLINPVAAHWAGTTTDSAVGQPFSQMFKLLDTERRQPIPDVVTGILQNSLPLPPDQEIVLAAEKEQDRFLAFSGAPIHNAQGGVDGVVIVLSDITEKVQAEEALLRARKLESLGVFAGGIAHDFNNMLTGLFTELELARRTVASDHEAQAHLQNAAHAWAEARGLTLQLLTFATGGEPVKEVQDIRQFLAESAPFAMHGSQSTLVTDVAPDLWFVNIDAGQFSQVLSNLIINAEQALPGGGTISLNAANVERDGQPYVQITVADDGIGISPEHLDRVFEPYFTTKPGGHGLGLSTVHSIVKKHDGDVTIASQEQAGTTFTILLPAIIDAEHPAVRAATGERNSKPAAPARILVLDDKPMVREALKGVLQMLGHQTTLTENGEDTLRAYRQAMETGEPFQAVILDLTIPGGKGGEEVAGELLQMDPEAQLIVASGYANRPIMSNYKEYGFAARLQKPFRIEDLQRVLDKILIRA